MPELLPGQQVVQSTPGVSEFSGGYSRNGIDMTYRVVWQARSRAATSIRHIVNWHIPGYITSFKGRLAISNGKHNFDD